MNLLEMYKQLSDEEKKELIREILKDMKKADKSTFLEQYQNALKATGDNPLFVK